MNTPAISVLMSAYNAGQYVEEAIKSILQQTFSDFELIIIDDGSTDNTISIIQSIDDDRIKFVQNGYSKGLIRTLNYGLTLAKGTYIARMDADDISKPEKFQKQYDFMEAHKDISVLGTGFLFMNKVIHSHPTDNEQIKIKLIEDTGLAHPSVMIRKIDMISHNLSYDISYPFAEDYKLWTSFALQNLKLANLPDILLEYRVHETQISTRKIEEQNLITSNIRKEYVNTIFYNTFNNTELEIINRNFKCTSLSELLPVIKKLKCSNDKIHFFDRKIFGVYLWDKIALLIGKRELCDILKSEYQFSFKYWIIRRYIIKVLKNILI